MRFHSIPITTKDTIEEIPYGHCQCGCGRKTDIASYSVPSIGWVKSEPKPCCPGHSPMIDLADRFWSKVDRSGGEDACWLWMASRTTTGYGQISIGRRGEGMAKAHRVAFTLTYGPIPDGLVIDHLCRNPLCVNPIHLECVSSRENTRRGESSSMVLHLRGVCQHGHEMVGDNVIVRVMPSGRTKNTCRTCRREWDRNHRKRPKQS
jgi:hypothetical protein